MRFASNAWLITSFVSIALIRNIAQAASCERDIIGAGGEVTGSVTDSSLCTDG